MCLRIVLNARLYWIILVSGNYLDEGHEYVEYIVNPLMDDDKINGYYNPPHLRLNKISNFEILFIISNSNPYNVFSNISNMLSNIE